MSQISNDQYCFNCKTDEAYNIKILSEIVSGILKLSFYTISNEGIMLKMMDNNQRMMLDIKLLSDNFLKYNLTDPDSVIHIGVNSTFFHKLLKSIKKKDTLELLLDKNKEVLIIQNTYKERQRVSRSSITVQTVQNVDINGPKAFPNSVIIKSGDFQKMIKDLNTIGSDNVEFTMKRGVITFSCFAKGIMGREISYGELDETNTKYNDYKCTFRIQDLNRIIKICVLGDVIHLHQCTEAIPLVITTTIRNIGEITTIIKQNELMESEY